MTGSNVWPTKHLTRQPVRTPLSIIFGRQIGFALVVPFSPTIKRRDTHQIYALAERSLFLVHRNWESGAGGYFQGQYFHTPFPKHLLEEYGHDINILELLAVMVALKLWAPALRGQRFILNCDNKNCVLSLNSGRSRTHAMQLCLREICFLSVAFDFDATTV